MIVFESQKLNYKIESVRSKNGLYLIMESWRNYSGYKFEYILKVLPIGSSCEFANQRAAFHRVGVEV